MADERIRPHSHTAAGPDHVIDYSRRENSAQAHVNTGRHSTPGPVVAEQFYVDHAGRPTVVREYEGKTDVFHGPDQVRYWPDGALKTKWGIVEEADRLAGSTQWKATGQRFRELLDEWKAAGRTNPSSDQVLWDRFSSARGQFFHARTRHFAERDRVADQARRDKEAIVAEARTLARSTEWKTTGDRFKELMTRWKSAGRAEREDEDRLWRDFDDARKTFQTARQRSFEEREREQEASAQRKKSLVDRAGSAARSSDLKAAGEAMRSLTDEWKRAGRASRQEEDRLWADFNAAREVLNRRRSDARAQRERDEATAKSRKLSIVSQAQSLAYGPDFKEAGNQMRALSDAWKQAGRASLADEDALWAQFNAARNLLRQNSQAAFEQRKREAAQRLREAIDRKRDALANTENRIRELESRLSELLSRPDPSHTNPRRWEIVGRRNESISTTQNKIGQMQSRRSDIVNQIVDMDSRWRSML